MLQVTKHARAAEAEETGGSLSIIQTGWVALKRATDARPLVQFSPVSRRAQRLWCSFWRKPERNSLWCRSWW